MSENPSDWTQAPIGDVFSVKGGDPLLTKSSYRKSGTLAYSGTGPDGFVEECQNHGKGIIISSVGAQCGKVFKASGGWTAINNTIAITEKNLDYDINYLYFILEKQKVLHRDGGAQPFISQKEVMGALIDFPPLPEQKKIAEILSGIDIVLARYKYKKTKLLQLQAALRNEIFNNIKGQVLCLENICRPKQWQTIPTHLLTTSGYPVYGANGQIGHYTEYNHKDPVLAVTCRGATCGNINLVPALSYVTGNSMCLDNLHGNVSINYLFHYLHWRGFKDVISGSAQPQITQAPLKLVQVVLPSLEKQTSIAGALESITRAFNSSERLMVSLKLQKQAIASDLLSGRKRVSI